GGGGSPRGSLQARRRVGGLCGFFLGRTTRSGLCGLIRSVGFLSGQSRIFCQFLPVAVPDDSCDVSAGLVIRWHALVLFNAVRGGIVSSESFHDIEIVFFKQLTEIPGSTLDVCLRIKGVCNSQLRCGLWHELHQSLRALFRHCAVVETTLSPDHAGDEVRINLMALASAINYFVYRCPFKDWGARWRDQRNRCRRRLPNRCLQRLRLRLQRRSCFNFEALDLAGGNFDVAARSTAQVQPRHRAHNLPALMADRISI